MPLTEEQIEHYFREGYVIARSLVPRDVVDEVMAAARPRVKQTDFWQPTVFDHTQPHIDAPIHRLTCEPGVIEAAGQLLGSTPRIYWGMLAVVPPSGGRGLPWHKDNQYTHILGGALNSFIALSRITPDAAMLWVAPRTHLRGVEDAKRSDEFQGHMKAVVEPENGICLPTLEPGDACIFDRYLYHRSLKNETNEPRFAYAAQYQSDHARRAEDGKLDPTRMRATDLRRSMLGWLAQPAAVQ